MSTKLEVYSIVHEGITHHVLHVLDPHPDTPTPPIFIARCLLRLQSPDLKASVCSILGRTQRHPASKHMCFIVPGETTLNVKIGDKEYPFYEGMDKLGCGVTRKQGFGFVHISRYANKSGLQWISRIELSQLRPPVVVLPNRRKRSFESTQTSPVEPFVPLTNGAANGMQQLAKRVGASVFCDIYTSSGSNRELLLRFESSNGEDANKIAQRILAADQPPEHPVVL
jgi:hypothetical protein